MKHPPYHLRSNKAVDRFMLIEAIRRLGSRPSQLAQYTYYGFGGPYLEEFRLLHEYFPEMNMVSIENNEETYKRQEFHLPCDKIELQFTDFGSFLARYDPGAKKSIFWLDYNKLKYSDFEEFKGLLGRVADGSIIKITLPVDCQNYRHINAQERGRRYKIFWKVFGEVLPDPNTPPPYDPERFAELLKQMLQIAAQQALPGETGRVFQPILMFYYKDGAPMFTLAGMVCLKNDVEKIRSLFSDWVFANLDWLAPKKIDVPCLSTKERLHLQRHLPCKDGTGGRKLLDELHYLIDYDEKESLDKMQQYADFYKYYPHFLRTIPV